jgi:hypothetical protein
MLLAKRQTMDLCNSLTVLDIRQATLLYLTPGFVVETHMLKNMLIG